MEAVIYDESPLADYLEGDAFPHDTVHTFCTPPPTPPHYAPTGLPRLRSRFHTIQQQATEVARSTNDRFLERLRYLVIASQLLSDDPKPRPSFENEHDPLSTVFTVTGALISTGLSFLLAWLIYRFRTQRQAGSWPLEEMVAYFIPLLLFLTLGATLAYLQYLRFVRRSAIFSLSRLIAEFQEFDAGCGAGIRYIQEMEVVSRGYRISQTLPPITLLESRNDTKHCTELRTVLASSVLKSIRTVVNSHNDIQTFVDPLDLDRYHNIYEVSLKEFAEGTTMVNQLATTLEPTLKELRVLFAVDAISRRIFLCDILALRSSSLGRDMHLWLYLSQSLEKFSAGMEDVNNILSKAVLNAEAVEPESQFHAETSEAPGEAVQTPARRHVKVQLRRFNHIANGIRSLATKTRLLRDEIDSLATVETPESTASTTLLKHYDNIGSELRSLLHEWETGRHSMCLNLDTSRRTSRRSSDFLSPISPSLSLGGVTMVEAAHADTLKALTGEDDPMRCFDSGSQDEEIFEAIALPRKRLSVAMTREEKMARIQEDRRKRATLQEQSQNTTNMLRELQMVIKHRPGGRRSSQAAPA